LKNNYLNNIENNIKLDEIIGKIVQKISKLTNNDILNNSIIHLDDLKEYINVEIIEHDNKRIYNFTLNEKWIEFFDWWQNIDFFNLLAEKESENLIKFDSLNWAIEHYNKNKSDDDDKINYIYNLDDLEKDEIKNNLNFKKEIEKINKKIRRKNELKELIWQLDNEEEIISNLKKYNLIEQFNKLKKEKGILDFEYQYTIEKPKNLKPHQIEEESIEPTISDKILRYRKQAIFILWALWLFWSLYLWDWKTEKIENSYSTQNFKIPKAIAQIHFENQKRIKITNEFIKNITIFLEKIKNKNNTLELETEQFKNFIDSQKDFETIKDYLIIKLNDEEWSALLNINWIITQINFNTKGENLENKKLDSVLKNLISKYRGDFEKIKKELETLMELEFIVKK